jgi:hypothetical protein
MPRIRVLVSVGAVVCLLAACGRSSSSADTTAASTSAPAITTTTVATSTVATTQARSTTTGPVTTTSTTAVGTSVPATQQMAIWPAADVVFTTPEAAATDFLAKVFGAGPVLGTFTSNDQRSGEIEVFASVDGKAIGKAKSTLVLRQLGPSNGWFVLAAASDVATITTPAAMSTVPAKPTTVEGVGTGFEATIVVSAFVAGQATPEFDRQVAMAGNFGEAGPYTVTLNLSGASPGAIVVLLVRGGTGLETDPGDFGAVPVLIGP